MTTRNTVGSLLTIEQRVVGRELTGFFFQHHRNIVANGIGEAVHSAHEHVRLTMIFERSLAHGTGQYFQHMSIHQRSHLPGAVASPVLHSTP